MTNRQTPLMRGARNGHYGVVKALLEAGAVPDTKDRSGASALDLAVQGESAE